MTKTAVKVVQKDNGYFETLERACGHQVRVSTECHGWELKHGTPEAKRRLRAHLRDQALASSCGSCTQFEIFHRNGYVAFRGTRQECREWIAEQEFDDYYDAEDYDARKVVK